MRDKAAGLRVLEGSIRKGCHARLAREDVIVSATTIASLRRFKDDVAEVRAGLECGVVLADTNDLKAGDHLEVFEVELRERTLCRAPAPHSMDGGTTARYGARLWRLHGGGNGLHMVGMSRALRGVGA